MSADATASTPSAGYEFTPAQNTLLASLADKMQGVGMVIGLIGCMNAAFAALAFLGRASDPRIAALPDMTFAAMVMVYLVTAIVYMAIGGWTRSAGFEFRKVADTQGKDVPHLINGLSELEKMYSLLYTLILFALVVFIVGATIGLVGLLTAPAVVVVPA